MNNTNICAVLAICLAACSHVQNASRPSGAQQASAAVMKGTCAAVDVQITEVFMVDNRPTKWVAHCAKPQMQDYQCESTDDYIECTSRK